MRYVRWPSRRGSWHVFVRIDQSGDVWTRCGRSFYTPTTSSMLPDYAESLPLNARSCESCLRFAAHDEQPDVPNDTVPG